MKTITSRSHKRFTHTANRATKRLREIWVQNPKIQKRHSLLSLQSLLKMCLEFPLYTGRSRFETLILNGLGWVGNSAKKTICMTFDRLSLILDRSSQTELHNEFCSNLIPTLHKTHTLSKFKTRLKTCFDHGLPTIQIRVLIH